MDYSFSLAGHAVKVAVITSRVADISAANLLLVNGDGNTEKSVELTRCGEFLVSNFTAPLAFITYHIQGFDTGGLMFAFETRQSAVFPEGSYTFTRLGTMTINITSTEIPDLLYRFQNLNPHGYTLIDFTAAVEPIGNFVVTIQPSTATLQAGESVNVTLTPVVVNPSLVQVGNSYAFNVTANDGCTTITSDAYFVRGRYPGVYREEMGCTTKNRYLSNCQAVRIELNVQQYIVTHIYSDEIIIDV